MKVGYAVLYNNEELVISQNHTILSKTIYKDYGEFEDTSVPWKNDSKRINKVKILDQVKSNCMEEWFYDCTNLTSLIDFKNLDVSDCEDFSWMFTSCTSLQDINALENWDVSNGTGFSCMFENCNSLQDISGLYNWNVSNGKDFSCMFENCNSLQDINGLYNWNVSNGKFFAYIFKDCKLLHIISLPNTMEYLSNNMFKNCNPLLKIHWKNHIYTVEDLLAYEEIF